MLLAPTVTSSDTLVGRAYAGPQMRNMIIGAYAGDNIKKTICMPVRPKQSQGRYVLKKSQAGK